MCFPHDLLQARQDLRLPGREVAGFAGIFVEVVQFVVRGVGPDIHMDELPRALSDGLPAAQFLELEVQVIVLFLPLPALPERQETDAVQPVRRRTAGEFAEGCT